MPGRKLPLASLPQKDRNYIRHAVRQGVDWIGLSFIRDASTILKAKSIAKDEMRKMGAPLPAKGERPPLLWIAKIEDREGVDRIDEIAQVADGLLVAQGDLPLGLAGMSLPQARDIIIRSGRRHNKPVLVGTNILASALEPGKGPTRKEISLIGALSRKGVSHLMLSAETAMNPKAETVVETLSRILQSRQH